jgi:hypothetical protein
MAVSTSAAVPFTVTSSGEFTTAGGLDGNGSPKSTLGTVGPNLLANTDSVSPGVAEFPPVTGVELLACRITALRFVVTISGRTIGMIARSHRTLPPPLRRRFAGSSVIDAARGGIVN